MSALRDAAQQALEALEFVGEDTPHWAAVKRTQASTALRAALAQEEQEPAAWMLEDVDKRHFIFRAVKPVAREWEKLTPLYTHPPRREWQGLTADAVFANDKIMAVNASLGLKMNQLMDLVRAIEAALKEKNA